MQSLLKKILKFLAIATLKKYKPGIIGVTGSVGKTSTKEAVLVVLSDSRLARASAGNFNTEIGLPLTILGNWKSTGGFFFWLWVILVSFFRLIFRVAYPELLILEYAADKPGDIKNLLDIARPHISILTAIGDVPVHVEAYSGPEAVAREKSKLIESLSVTGFAVLNYDDPTVRAIAERTRAHVITFGFEDGADVRISNFEMRSDKGIPLGVSFKLGYAGSFVPVRLDHAFGRAPAYAAAAATAVGIAFGFHLVKISEALLAYVPPEHRMRLISGIKGSVLFDDTYNASPLSMREAIQTVKSLGAKRNVGILGDMLELGHYSLEAHEAIGLIAGEVFDVLITVGPRAKFIADAAFRRGLSKSHIFSFDTAKEAARDAHTYIKKGDVVLLKASRAIGLEVLVEALRDATLA